LMSLQKVQKTQNKHNIKQDKPYRMAKYYRVNLSNMTINFKFGGFVNCLDQMTIIVKENYLAISSGSTPL